MVTPSHKLCTVGICHSIHTMKWNSVSFHLNLGWPYDSLITKKKLLKVLLCDSPVQGQKAMKLLPNILEMLSLGVSGPYVVCVCVCVCVYVSVCVC